MDTGGESQDVKIAAMNPAAEEAAFHLAGHAHRIGGASCS